MSHDHSHTVHRDAVPRRALWILLPAALATLAGLLWLWPYDYEPEQQEHNPQYKAEVLRVVQGECPEGQEQAGIEGPCGEVGVRVLTGPEEGEDLVVDLPTGPGSPQVEVGDTVVLMYLEGSMTGQQYYIVDQERSPMMWAALIAFVLAIIAFGRWKGVRSLVSLSITFAIVLLFIVPAILDGSPPMFVAIAGSAAIMLASLFLTHGWNRTTTVAVLGTLAALVITGILAAASTSLAHLTGIMDEDTSQLSLYYDLDMSGLLLAGIIIGALGVIDDITISQSATIDELSKANPGWSTAHLFGSGMRVGRDHITSVVNTLVLAYAGASLPLLVLLAASDAPAGQVLTNELIAAEIIRSVVGTLGLIAAVPITTYLAAVLVKRRDGGRGAPEPAEEPVPARKRPKPQELAWDEDQPYPPGHTR
ncbi:YibE/F family protein [Salininema proteolyticum]|uniref:YibE/F family protein n=1 Tax=Salininema proteolyticum TaxID=1607685 RepID=A0ABV8U0B6_9ACTN